MENGQAAMLKRGDLVPEGSYKKYKEIMSLIKEVRQDAKRTKDLKMVAGQMQDLYWKENEFLMDLFETREFPKLFDFFENV